MRKTYERCLELAAAGLIRRTPAFTYEDVECGDVWDDLIYRLADDGLLALGEDGSVHTTASRQRDFTYTRAARRRNRQPVVADPFTPASEGTPA